MPDEVAVPQLSIVVPVFNNASTLVLLFDCLYANTATLNIDWELILVNDASRDNSLAVAQQLFHLHNEVTVLNLVTNMGQHSAVLLGLNEARGKWALVMDADLQDPPEAIGALWQQRKTRSSAIFAGRRGDYESSFRLLTGRIFRRIMAILTLMPVDAGMFVLMDHSLVQRLLAMSVTRPFVPAMIACAGIPMLSIPVARNVRLSGDSAYTFGRRLQSAGRAFLCIWELRRHPQNESYLSSLTLNPVKRRYSHFS